MKKRDLIIDRGCAGAGSFMLGCSQGCGESLPGRMPHGYGSLWAEKSTELTACLKIRP